MPDFPSEHRLRTDPSQSVDELIRSPSDEALDEAVASLRRGELVAIPTETVYGLAANAWDKDAVSRIFAAKGRPANNPVIVHVAGVDRLSDAIAWPLPKTLEGQLESLVDLWPGPLTVVAPRSAQISDVVTSGRDTVAVRIPAHGVALDLLARCPFPLAAPSANPSRYVSPTTAQHVRDGLGDSVAMILDGGACRLGVESTIVALSDQKPELLRPGGITLETLRERLGDLKLPLKMEPDETQSEDGLRSPGMMREHYCPATVFRLMDPHRQPSLGPHVGRIAFQPIESAEASRYAAVEVLSPSGDLREVAHNLFAAMRKLDQMDLDEIHCDKCVEEGLGLAIMDRLRRATASG